MGKIDPIYYIESWSDLLFSVNVYQPSTATQANSTIYLWELYVDGSLVPNLTTNASTFTIPLKDVISYQNKIVDLICQVRLKYQTAETVLSNSSVELLSLIHI
eukprot:TRINITY_DN18963_c0_g1_i1.p1 TRINITY_DN18963_c0_g1~~TRINITY_DN18963_c0_g1_i1.p1  ORF type:complete len:103 (-),score=7.34 TRINITY_DN18963_c0_g1_i1:59-367(-)